MCREMDWGTPEYSTPFTLMAGAMHIKYWDGEGRKNWGREMAEYTLHSTLIALMDRKAFKYRTDGRAWDRIRIRDGKTQTIRLGGGSSSAVTSDGILLMTNSMEPHFHSTVHLTAPVWTFLPPCSLYPSFSGCYSNYVCLKETDHSAQSPC